MDFVNRTFSSRCKSNITLIHNGIDYSKERAMVPRRIQYDFDKYIANSDYVNQHPEYANDTYAEFVEGFSVHGAAIYGFTESLSLIHI